jgi:serine/threonine protein kinase
MYINNNFCKNNNNKKLIPKEIKNVILNKRNKNDLNSKRNSKKNYSKTLKNNSNIIRNNSNDKWNKKLSQFNFNDYTIITQLGQGSFGKIYLVKDSKGNIYSMKKILLSEELDVKAVIDEYNLCYNLNHPNIIKILGIYSNKLDETTFVVYVLMEVGISDWEKEIKSYKTKKILYKEQELIDILKQLISSLSFLQKNNISHRDIKPQNILIFKNKVYKLTDFGEAKKVGGKDGNNKNILQNSLKGTELYMSPLLFNGLRTGQIDIKHNTYKSDVYSLGLCLLYAASTRDKTLFEIRRIIEMPKVRKYVELHLKNKFSDKLINIIISMLEIYEQNRPDFIELEKIIGSY